MAIKNASNKGKKNFLINFSALVDTMIKMHDIIIMNDWIVSSNGSSEPA